MTIKKYLINSKNKLIFFSNKIRLVFAVILMITISCVLGYVISHDNNKTYMYYFLIGMTGFSSIISIGYLKMLFTRQPVIEVDLSGILIRGIFKKTFLSWNKTLGIIKWDYSPTIIFMRLDKTWPLEIFSPAGITIYNFYEFLTRAQSQILDKQITNIDELNKFLITILEENKLARIVYEDKQLLLQINSIKKPITILVANQI